MSELKPCPFCGGDVELVGINVQLQKMRFVCSKCGAEVVLNDDVEWNTRHYPPEVQQAVERMKPVVIKPKLLDEYHPDGSVYLIKCENCKQEYKLIGFEFSSEIQHCRKCGQAQLLDWDEDGRIDTALQKP